MASQLSEKRRVEALFKALASDYLLREQFVTDPSQILTEYVRGKRLDSTAAAAANHLVYAVVSNPGLYRWLSSYARTSGDEVSQDQFLRDFARALARDGDEQTQLAVLRAASEPKNLFSVQARVLRGLISVLRGSGGPGSVFAGTEMSSPGTEMSPGQAFRTGTEMSSPGTEMSPGQAFRTGTEMSSPGTEMSPGQFRTGTEMSSPGTEMSPGQVFRTGTEMSSPGTEMSPGQFRTGTEMSSPGTEMSPGQAFRTGTEMSSPGTEMSPGQFRTGTEMSSPGTEMSPGQFRTGTEMSSPGTEMSPGQIFAGTEMSSPGTEISPGSGTNISPGQLGRIDIEVTLQALVDFATELRRAGALNTVRFR